MTCVVPFRYGVFNRPEDVNPDARGTLVFVVVDDQQNGA